MIRNSGTSTPHMPPMPVCAATIIATPHSSASSVWAPEIPPQIAKWSSPAFSDAGAGEWGRAATNDLVRSKIKIKSLNFMRGRTFLNKFVIIDEAQNLTPKQMKTLITRAGPGTKIVCLGNLAQIDTPYLTEGSSGLTYAVDRFKGWAHSGHVTLARGERLLLHFGAVDYQATVWVNGVRLAYHEGGYTPFTLDLTDVIREGGPQVVVVHAEDDPQDLAKPRGKQDWQREPHSIWYQRTSGIWQTVWLERVSATYIAGLRWTSSLERWEVGLDTHVTDVVRLLEVEGLEDVVLVGHSYAGQVLAGVAAQRPALLRRVIHLDAFVPEDGEAAIDLDASGWWQSWGQSQGHR